MSDSPGNPRSSENQTAGQGRSGHPVSLVIPGRNCSGTLDKCLRSVLPMLESGELQQIIFVNDGSTDNSETIARQFPVQIIHGTGQGPGAARNLGWRAAESELIWFIDSDCVADPDALQKLLPHLDDPDIAGAGGTYTNLYPNSILAILIQEEISARHRRMPSSVNFLGGFNVLYRRSALELANGFDEKEVNGPRAPGAEDCDLSFRLIQSGYRLRFEIGSVVGHHHPRSLRQYLRSQRIHGHWRVRLYRRHLGRIGGDSYSGPADHFQPVSGLLVVCGLPFIPLAPFIAAPVVLAGCIINLMCALAIVRRLQLRFTSPGHLTACFVAMSSVRSVWRGIGIVSGLLSCVTCPPHTVEMPKRTPNVNDDSACALSVADSQRLEAVT
jgi:GT2 family glycosyltransferase